LRRKNVALTLFVSGKSEALKTVKQTSGITWSVKVIEIVDKIEFLYDGSTCA
jgi:hypothetical protein